MASTGSIQKTVCVLIRRPRFQSLEIGEPAQQKPDSVQLLYEPVRLNFLRLTMYRTVLRHCDQPCEWALRIFLLWAIKSEMNMICHDINLTYTLSNVSSRMFRERKISQVITDMGNDYHGFNIQKMVQIYDLSALSR
jgi:hypothetical protein